MTRYEWPNEQSDLTDVYELSPAEKKTNGLRIVVRDIFVYSSYKSVVL